jgi:hypothetical protein
MLLEIHMNCHVQEMSFYMDGQYLCISHCTLLHLCLFPALISEVTFDWILHLFISLKLFFMLSSF